MARSQRRRRQAGGHEEGNNERWLLTYADMITLLMALFMVLFAISSVNISKFHTLQQALRAAFSGNPLPGGKAIAHPGASANSSRAPTSVDIQAIVPVTAPASNLETVTGQHATVAGVKAAAAREQNEFQQIKRELEAYAARHGLSSYVHTTVEPRGLVIRVLTDSLLFPSGSATLDPKAQPLLVEVAGLLNVDTVHPITVEGNTDNAPIVGGSIFPSNWELSTARASMVVRSLISEGVNPERLSAAGYADLRPIASNASPAGRALNRRVEIVLQRIY